MERICDVVNGLRPALLMVVAQLSFAGVNVFYKLAANDGMNLRIIIAYRFIFSTAFIVPMALIFGRKSRPKLTWVVLFQAFLCGLFGGSLGQNLYIQSLNLTSATFAAAMNNLVPAVTFILAVSFGLEKLNLGTVAGKAKMLGTLTGIGGAMLLTFYNGPEINLWRTNVNLLHHGQSQAEHSAYPRLENHLLGCILALASCFTYASWLIIQTKMNEAYPCYYSSAALLSGMSAIQAAVFALCTGRDWNQWKLGWNIRLLAASYTGIIATGLMAALIAWCVHMKGPLFVSVFNPLTLVSVAIMASLILGEKLHLGSILGAVLIACGLYAVLWGKGKDMKKITQLPPSKSYRESHELTDINVIKSPVRDVDQKNSAISNTGSMKPEALQPACINKNINVGNEEKEAAPEKLG